MDSLIPIIVGFLLTTVLGGALGTWLQQRTWDHQRTASLSDRELQKADDVCQQVSRLLDKRLYRMLRLFYALRSTNTPDGSTEIAEARLKDYDAILYEWNDQLNLNLALIGAYFGQTARDWLHFEIYEQCQTVGAELEAMYKHVVQKQTPTIDIAGLERDLSALNEQVYRLGVFMMTQLRSGNVGRTAPDPVIRHASPSLVTDPPMTLPGIASHTSPAAQPETKGSLPGGARSA